MYLNIFRSRKCGDMDGQAYSADAARMQALARVQKGFIAYRSYAAADGETLSMSEWETEEDARAWQRQIDHARVQAKGRSDYYESYTVYSCANPHVRTFTKTDA